MSTGILGKIGTLDKRILYWIIFAALAIPFISPIGLPVFVTPTSQAMYDSLHSLKKGDVVVLGINFGVSAWSECLPGAVACVKMVVRQEAKLIVFGMGTTDVAITWDKIKSSIPAFGAGTYKEGDDYAFFGFLPIQETTINLMATNFRAVFSKDAKGTLTDNIPMMKNFNGAKDCALILSSDTGDVGDYFIKYWQVPFHVPTGWIGIAMNASTGMAYIRSGNLVGLLSGVRGGAEMEKLIGEPGAATTNMDSISVSHLCVVIAVIIANVSYFATRRKK
jgi:hypothetical protein